MMIRNTEHVSTARDKHTVQYLRGKITLRDAAAFKNVVLLISKRSQTMMMPFLVTVNKLTPIL